MAADIEAIRARWPASPNDLPEAALVVFAAWSRATEETIRKALEDEVGRGFVKPKGNYTKTRKKMTRPKMTRTKMKAWRTNSHLQKMWSYQKIKKAVKSKKLSRHKVNFHTPPALAFTLTILFQTP
jgi:hypothetical protein